MVYPALGESKKALIVVIVSVAKLKYQRKVAGAWSMSRKGTTKLTTAVMIVDVLVVNRNRDKSKISTTRTNRLARSKSTNGDASNVVCKAIKRPLL